LRFTLFIQLQSEIGNRTEAVVMLDLSGLIAEVRPIVQPAAAIYLRHTRPWFIGLIAHGSAVKGDYIPGCSDIDLQLYLEDAAFTDGRELPLEVGLAIHRELAQIDPAPFQYIQCYARPARLPDDYVGPIPGAYHVVAGRLPVAEATAEQLRASAYQALAQLKVLPSFIPSTLLQHGGGKLARQVRLLCTIVWPTLYQVLALQHADPLLVWRLPKQQAIALLPAGSPIEQAIRRFYAALQAYYPAAVPVEQGLAAIASGVAVLREARQWWQEAILPKSAV
jgi:hypothetical protein